MSSLNLVQKVLIWRLWKKIDREYLETRNISSEKKFWAMMCLRVRIGQKQIDSVYDFVINEHYMQEGVKYYVSTEIRDLCRDKFFLPRLKKRTKEVMRRLIPVNA